MSADTQTAEDLSKYETPDDHPFVTTYGEWRKLIQRALQAELAARTNAETVVRQANELRRLAVSKSQQKRYDAQQGISE